MKTTQLSLVFLLLFNFLYGFASNPNEKLIPLELTKIHFCNEILPLHQSHVARQFSIIARRFDRNLRSNLLSKAKVYFKVIEPILKKNNIPLDFKYLCVIESGFEAKALSPRGAYGYWQFMPATAKAMGLTITKKVDERTNLAKSTQAACRYFKELHEQFGSWTIVAAAYNAGPAQAAKYIRKAKSDDYYDWKTSAETRQYLYKIVVVKEWLTQPTRLNHITDLIQSLAKKEISPVLLATNTKPAISSNQEPTATVANPLGNDIKIVSVDLKPKTVDEVKMTIPEKPLFDLNRTLATKVKEVGTPQKGQTWVFEVTEEKRFGALPVELHDKLYAVVENYDTKNQIVTLKTIQLYSPRKHQLYQLNLTSITAHSIGIQWPVNEKSTIYWAKL